VAAARLFLIFFGKTDAHRDTDDRCAGEKGDPGPACLGADMPMDKEDGADDRIEETPGDIDGRGGETLARWFGERSREFVAGDALDKMGNSIRQKDTGEKGAKIDSEDHVTWFTVNIRTVCYIRSQETAVSRFAKPPEVAPVISA
jgi:hypothetical protein